MTGDNPAALTIAGSDSSGGAGIQADLRTFAAFGVQGASAITALTAQDACAVRGIVEVPEAFVVLQATSALASMPVRAIKTGMLANAAIVEAVATMLAARDGAPLVVDPVLRATSGTRLLAEDALDALRGRLVPLAAVLTPNLPEAAALLGEEATEAPAWDSARQAEVARALLELGPAAVLLKGGHAHGNMAADVLVSARGLCWLEAPRLDVACLRGTGCTLSAALAAGLALGHSLEDAARGAKAYVTAALRRGIHLPQAAPVRGAL
jgi:hydroxymethylpyrimidine/phosphomethylpyrimidine kinase